MQYQTRLEMQVQRWTEVGLIDAETASRILAHEKTQERSARLRWPVYMAMVFGGILFAAGITLFVAAHWNELSPAIRFSLVLSMVGVLHIGGAVMADRFPLLSATFHALGTVALGAAIFLTAQIFNLHENWATGVLLWALGAAVGYILVRDWPQAAALALLAPAWLISQWTIMMEQHQGGSRPLSMGLILTAVCYLTAGVGYQENTARRTLVWIGGIALLPCVGIAIGMAMDEGHTYFYNNFSPLTPAVLAMFWTIALAAPLFLSWLLRGRSVWMNVLCAVWAYAVILTASYSLSFRSNENFRNISTTLMLYVLCAVGSAGLVAWGFYEKRKERLNLGIAGFALSVLFFYFDTFMTKLGRSVSLLLLGLICLAGGYFLEVTRRKLMAQMEWHL